jgi:hypothetical protein
VTGTATISIAYRCFLAGLISSLLTDYYLFLLIDFSLLNVAID